MGERFQKGRRVVEGRLASQGSGAWSQIIKVIPGLNLGRKQSGYQRRYGTPVPSIVVPVYVGRSLKEKGAVLVGLH
jgi:hypothetical protein